MALTTLTTDAMEEGIYPITVAFTDENGDAVIPTAASIFWTLTTEAGIVINGRDYETKDSAASITIVLSGSDLAIQSGETAPVVRRRLTVKWTYTSDLGAALPGKAEVIFRIRNLTRIPVAIP